MSCFLIFLFLTLHRGKVAKLSKPLIIRLIFLYKISNLYYEFVKGLGKGLKIMNCINPVTFKSNLW